jgi:hypothetical protein
MKKIIKLLLATGLFVAVAGFIFSSCTKEGPQGAPGTNGKDGKDGLSAITCQECHNFSDTIVAKIFQYDASRHATGSTLLEASNNQCAPCHSSQGFAEVLATGAFKTAAGITDAAPINCRTCHQIHKTYTNADWTLATTAPYRMRYDSTVTVNLAGSGGTANLCGRCHQARAANPPLTNPSSNTDSINITSTRWGPHHGPQSNVLSGRGAYNDGAFRDSPHKDLIGCINCHGRNAQGNLVGGHTLIMTSSETGDNFAVCLNSSCHPDATSFDVDGKQTEIQGLYQQLKVKLAAFNMLDTNQMLINKKKYAQADLAVFWNFMLVDADRSMGVHNYKYTYDLLQDGITHFTSKGY